MSLYLALLHHPVYNRTGQVVTTSVANMDIHDLARASRTYGVECFFIVTPILEQRKLVDRILRHWKLGFGAGFNPSRKEAFQLAKTKESLDEAIRDIRETGQEVKLVATGAGLKEGLTSHTALREMIALGRESFLLLFGTGSGLADEITRRADYRLEPLRGKGAYNHLSVRSAAAITLDRLCRAPSLP